MKVFFKVTTDEHLFVWEGASMSAFHRTWKQDERPLQAKRVEQQVNHTYKDVFVNPEHVTYWWQEP